MLLWTRIAVLIVAVGACKDPADERAECARLAKIQVGCLGGDEDLQERMRASYEESCLAAMSSADRDTKQAIRAELDCVAKSGTDCEALAACLGE